MKLNRRCSSFGAGILASLCALVSVVSAWAADPYANAPSYARVVSPKTKVTPIVTVGQQIPLSGGPVGDSFRLVGIPDGMGAVTKGRNLTLFLNHEFEQTQGGTAGPLPSGARISELTLGYRKGGAKSATWAKSGKYAIEHIFAYVTDAFQEITDESRMIARFCSAFLGTGDVGFDRPIFLNGEEEGTATTFDGQGGSAFATFDGKAYQLAWMGHAAWENVVAAPFTGAKTVVFGMEDGPSDGDALHSQLYMYVGQKNPGSTDPLVKNGLRDGQLYVFAGDDIAMNSEAAFNTKGATIGGHWEAVDWNQDAASLDAQSIAAGSFMFVRVEDGAADPKIPGVFYFVTTGARDKAANPYGRLYRLNFNPANPAGGASLTVLLDGSEGMVSPDNIAVNKHGEIAICEDPNYNLTTQLPAPRPFDTSLWVYSVETGGLTRVLEMDRQTAYDHAVGADAGNAASTLGTPGSWEFSGVIDAEKWLGRGSWLLDVQAHTLRIAPTTETVQGGQLLHLVWKPEN